MSDLIGNDWYTEYRRRRLLDQQASFRRNCLWLSLGFMLLGAIITVNLWR